MFYKLKKELEDQRGLTLIELLAVIVIIGIVAAIAVPSIGKVIDNSRIEAVKADATQILNAAKLYVAEESMPATKTIVVDDDTNDLAPYLESVTTFPDGYTIKITNENVFEINGTGVKGGAKVIFNDASVSDISAAGKGKTTIPVPKETK